MFHRLQSVSKVFACPAVEAHLGSLTLGCRVRNRKEAGPEGKCWCHQPVDTTAKNGKFHRELGSSYTVRQDVLQQSAHLNNSLL